MPKYCPFLPSNLCISATIREVSTIEIISSILLAQTVGMHCESGLYQCPPKCPSVGTGNVDLLP